MPAAEEILRKYFGYSEFRPPQAEIIRSVLEGKDTLALLPTGGGKSVCFQVPALTQEGICLVISPLIALMKDQVAQLKKRDIRAAAIFTGLSYPEIDAILDNCVYGHYKFLYVSPERLKTELFIERFKKMKLSLIAVDEAHCISQWGYDFRPPYREIAEIRKHHPNVPILALTATATPPVQKDIVEKLSLKDPAIFKKSFLRDNLSFVVRREDAKLPKLLEIVKKLKGSGIVYVRNRNKTKETAGYLKKNNIAADFYHAGLKMQERSAVQDSWLQNKTQVIVCTNAFGMGIDKPDVRFVIHLDVPDSLEAYYQEAGRAGRDGKLSYAALLYTQNDIDELKERSERQFPETESIKRVYNALCNHLGIAVGSGFMQSFDFDLLHFARQFKLDTATVYNSLKILEQEAYLQLSEGVMLPSRVVFSVDKMELYRFEVAHSDYAALIRTLLRAYGGIIDHYTRISEAQLAQKLRTSEQDIRQKLKFLQRNKLLVYVPASDQPKITMLTERLHENNLRINTQYLKQRKKVNAEQLQAMLGFIQQDKQCRQQYVAAYFGEKEPVQCGRCDICIEAKTKKATKAAFDKVKKHILQQAGGQWMKLEHLLPGQEHFGKQLYKDVIRFLLDEKMLELNDRNEIRRK